MTAIGIVAGLLPSTIMDTGWFAVLSAFVAINTLLYLTVAIVKLLPKLYLSDWIDRGNRRSETRNIDPNADRPATRV